MTPEASVGRRQHPSATPKIGKEELAVFQYIQSHAPVTVREVADHFMELGKARTTVLTVMERLREKGLLTREKVSGAFRYTTAMESETLLKSLVGDFVEGVLGGSLAPFMAYITEANALTSDEVKELKTLVRQLESEQKKSS
ncbi:MAG: BlaI/MecI/CopY family transcriptional regulator [Rubripirellula sp.]